MEPIVQRVALDMEDGSTCVMLFVVSGNGVPDRAPTPENIEAEIARAGYKAKSWRLIDEAEHARIRASRPRPEPNVWVQETPPPLPDVFTGPTVEQERDRRIAKGFKFDGSLYPATPEDYSRIASFVSEATAAVATGIQGGNLRWHDKKEDFTWTDANGIPVPLDAQQMIALGRAANAHRLRLDRLAYKLMTRPGGPPPDFTDDSYWI